MHKKLYFTGFIVSMVAAYAAYLFYLNTQPASVTSLAMAPEVFDANGELQGSLPVVLEFSATWCGPCRAEAPVIQAARKEWEGKLKFVLIDVDQDQRGLSKIFKVEAIPTIIVVKPHSTQAFSHTGYLDRQRLNKFIEDALKASEQRRS